ncbi:RIP metalloprotease RseP [Campylobacter sp. MIT 21-1685]|uniref:RIP metalloprotease RseP n=1 Tax=unclassified Campylobacter TaxID=2593542 RepID=UPI00224A6F4F|nr:MULTISPECIES: RIP metalloprotease RseP [unclassified Campylobacter]MCX2683137.1 RIP metalloprotease RseP [Campylobacter sp. MIT 21-1684]MCX2751403.1 RIP metalloprotease RseP [Campylobacter sp. MIT 21-1682]MCX2807603.1 RIP metalloprotease RseP [Campylobacter sp. MIT 21-1685]
MKSLLFVLFLFILGFQFYSVEFFITILVLSFLIFFHELGHFLAAKYLGVKVEIFSIGFGKALYEYELKGTKYRLSALTLGGYVKLKGQDDFQIKEEKFDKDSYSALHPIQKIFILFAGPFFNLLLAFLLYLCIAYLGVQKFAPEVGKVAENSSAQKAGIQTNDVIKAINGVSIQSFDDIPALLQNKPSKILIERDGKEIELDIIPQIGQGYNDFGQVIPKVQLGILPKGTMLSISYRGFQSFVYAFNESINASLLIIKGIVKLLSGELEAKNLGGILTMVDITSKAANSSFVVLLLITALLSINLGILNLLPIPMLDGGHILFNLYELLFGHKLGAKTFEYLSYFGMILLGGLMIFATFNDIVRFVSRLH